MADTTENNETAFENLEPYKITEGPRTIYYIPDFVSEAEEKYLLKNVYEAPLPKWTQLSKRRLQNWGGLPEATGMIAEQLPSWLIKYTKRIGSIPQLFGGKSPNHVLVNEYLPGQGIMPHLDGPLFYPTITTISLGSHTVINFYRPLETDIQDITFGDEDDNKSSSTGFGTWFKRLEFGLLLQPRSLLILQDSAYDYYLHGIDEVLADTVTPGVINASKCGVLLGDVFDRSTRISLTIRHVPKTTQYSLFGKKR